MSGLPKFSATQEARLRTLGVSAEQIHELRRALLFVRGALTKPTAKNDLKSELDEIADLSSRLSRKLRVMGAISPTLGVLIESGWWQRQPNAHGPTVAASLCPPLDALAETASEAMHSVASKPSRHRKADWRPVAEIAAALVDGWIKMPGNVSTHEHGWTLTKHFPKEFASSTSLDSTFGQIVCVCYEACGSDTDPRRSLAAYSKGQRQQRRELLDGLDNALSSEAKGGASGE